MTEHSVVISDQASQPDADLYLCPGLNLRTGAQNFQAMFGDLTSLEDDLLTVASGIFASDLAFKRGMRQSFQARVIRLNISVVNVQAFRNIRDRLQRLLYFLSRDCWQIEFQSKFGTLENQMWASKKEGATILFSGGLDSFSGAIDLIDSVGVENSLLVSHQTNNAAVVTSQESLLSYITSHYGKAPFRLAAHVTAASKPNWPFPDSTQREPSQRTRCFVFVVLAALAARRLGHNRIVHLAENGQMAIHLPLSKARIGAFSTHTAHPEFLELVQPILSDLLQRNVVIENPFLYKTKGEVVSILTPKHQHVLEKSISCWKRVMNSKNHCGECIPCIIRRISLEHNNIFLDEYARDLFKVDVANLAADDNGKRNLLELLGFVMDFSSKSEAELTSTYLELLNPSFDSSKALELYRRFSAETLAVISKYPFLMAVVS